jgi:hypothetical protein
VLWRIIPSIAAATSEAEQLITCEWIAMRPFSMCQYTKTPREVRYRECHSVKMLRS